MLRRAIADLALLGTASVFVAEVAMSEELVVTLLAALSLLIL
jgi:hypothetical protein